MTSGEHNLFGVNMRKKMYIGTNTKMFKTASETVDFLGQLYSFTADIERDEIELFVIPSYTSLGKARETVSSSQIKIGAQNISWEDRGQFTGEISPLMLKEIGIDLVMIGHSERRHIFGEKDAEENMKVLAALKHGFTALLCVGETEEQKESGISDEVLRTQVKYGLKNVSPDMSEKIWLAYEPVWAIGIHGKPATSEYADEKHKVIKDCLVEIFGNDTGSSIPVMYGGSVNNMNSIELIQKENVDGLFIGRSAWDAENFNSIIRSVLPLFRKKVKKPVGQ